MRRKSVWIVFSLIVIIILVILGLYAVSRMRQFDYSYNSSAQNVVIYSDLKWYPVVPPPAEPTCLGQFFPSLRVWGDGLVFLDPWTAGQPELRYWTGWITSEKIQALLASLRSYGFFGGWTPVGPNPAATWLRIGVHLNNQSWEYSTGDLSPKLYTQLIDQLMPQLSPVDPRAEIDFRVTGLIDAIQSCLSGEQPTPISPEPETTPQKSFVSPCYKILRRGFNQVGGVAWRAAVPPGFSRPSAPHSTPWHTPAGWVWAPG
jgi:hypothetical protein